MTHVPDDSPPSITVEIGEVFAGKYVIERELGAGGMGVVMAARHQQLGQTVAIKLLAVPPSALSYAVGRFKAEAHVAAALRSEHIARVMDADVDDKGRHYIVMEYLQGMDLARLLRESGPLPIGDAVGYILQACEGIAEAHSLGIVHRDLKPENLFVTRRKDGSPVVKVLDFGISKMLSNDLRPEHAVTPRGALMGSPLYMSPEQLRGPSDVSPQSDIWGLGVILYELLTDKIPFSGSQLPEVVAAVLSSPPAPVESLRPDVPAELAAAIAKALQKEASARFGDVSELARALGAWAPAWASDCVARASRTLGIPAVDARLSGDSRPIAEISTLTPPPVAVATPAPAQPRRKGAAIAAAVAVIAIASGALLLRGGGADAPPAASAPVAPVAPARTAAAPAPAAPPIETVVSPPKAPSARPAASRRVEARLSPRVMKQKAPPHKKSAVDPLDGRR